MISKEYFSLFVFLLQLCIAIKTIQRSREDAQSKTKSERQVCSQGQVSKDESRIQEEQPKEVKPCEDKKEQNPTLIQKRERTCSFSELHVGGNTASHQNTFTHFHQQQHDSDVNSKQKDAHPMPQTPMFKPQSNQMKHQRLETQDKKELQLSQKPGVINLDLDQDSMETEQDLHENRLGRLNQKDNQGFKETQNNQNYKVHKGFQLRDEANSQLDYMRIHGNDYQLKSTGSGVFSNQSRESHLRGLLKKRHHLSDRIDENDIQEEEEEDDHSNYTVNKVYEVFKKQKIERLQRIQTQTQQQKINQMSYLSVPYVNQVHRTVEKSQIIEKQRQVSQQQEQVSPSISSIQSQQKQAKYTAGVTEIEQLKDSQNQEEIKNIPCVDEKKESILPNKLESIQTSQPILATSMFQGNLNNKNSQLFEQKLQEKEQPNVLVQSVEQNQQVVITQQQEKQLEKLEPENKGGLFGNLQVPLISPVSQLSNVQKQPQAQEEQVIVKKQETQQSLEPVQQPKQEQLLQAPESKKVAEPQPQSSSVQTSLFSNLSASNTSIAQPNNQLDTIKQQEKIPQQSLFNNSGLFSEKQSNQKVTLNSNSSESQSVVSSILQTKTQGPSLFSNITPKPIGSLFSQDPSKQENKEQLGNSLFTSKQTNGQLEQKPESTNKPQESVKLFENSTFNSSSLQNPQKDEIKVSSTPLVGGLFSEAIKNSGSSQPGLFSSISNKNGLFAAAIQQQTQPQLFKTEIAKTEVDPKKDVTEKKQQPETRSLFSNLSSSQANSNNTLNSVQPKNSLFSSSNTGTGLFSQLQPNPLSQINQIGGLFKPQNTQIETKLSNDTSSQNTGNITPSNQPLALPKTGLFAPISDNNNSNISKGSLFTIPNGSSQSKLFSSSGLFESQPTQKPSGGLFGNLTKPSNSTLFASAAPSQSN